MEGLRPRNTPPFTSLWTTYRSQPDGAQGAGVEGRARVWPTGSPTGRQRRPSNVARLPPLGRHGLLRAGEIRRQLNVLNLLDKRYYESVYENGGHAWFPGTKRTAQLSLEYKF